jgi:hypothetical protein
LRWQLLSEWDIDSDLTPAAIAERRHPFSATNGKQAVKNGVPLALSPSEKKAEAKKQMLMYGNVELPGENFSWKKESGAPQCEDGCAFKDKVFTVDGFDQLCMTHCGEIDAMLRAASKDQRKGAELAQQVVRQQLAAMQTAKGQKLESKEAWSKSPNFSTKGYWPLVGDKAGRKLTKLLVNKEEEAWHKENNFNAKGYWPLNGNEDKLQHLELKVNGWPVQEEREMPEQYSKETVADGGFYKHFFDTGEKLKKAGVSVRKSGEHLTGESGYKPKKMQLDQNFKTSGYWPLAGEPNALQKEGVVLDSWPQGKENAMPEQYSEEDPTQLSFYQHFFDTGSRLEGEGVNMKKNPVRFPFDCSCCCDVEVQRLHVLSCCFSLQLSCCFSSARQTEGENKH